MPILSMVLGGGGVTIGASVSADQQSLPCGCHHPPDTDRHAGSDAYPFADAHPGTDADRYTFGIPDTDTDPVAESNTDALRAGIRTHAGPGRR